MSSETLRFVWHSTNLRTIIFPQKFSNDKTIKYGGAIEDVEYSIFQLCVALCVAYLAVFLNRDPIISRI